MDSSSWILGYGANSGAGGGNSGFMCGYAARFVHYASYLDRFRFIAHRYPSAS